MPRAMSCRDEKGQVLPLMLLFLLVLLGILSLVIDGGMAYAQRRYMQNAADAATLAGAVLLSKGVSSDAQIADAAAYYAQANRATSVTIDYINAQGTIVGHAGTGSIPGSATGLRVIASSQYRPSFAAILGVGSMTVSASAKASVRSQAGNATILALSETACPGFDATGSGTVTANGGNIHVNAHCSQALRQTGSGSLRAVGGQITVVGGYSKVGSGTATPPPITGAAVIPDPLAALQPPNIGSYPVRHGTPNDPDTLLITGSSSTTLDPGVYYGGIKVTGSGNVTLQPGVYIIAGGELTFTGSGHIIADGVFVYLTNDPWHPSGDGAYASLEVTGSSGSRFRPMSSGPYANLTFFQDRANTNQAEILGSGDLLGGTCYFPKARLKVAGSGNLVGTAQLIVDTIELTGSGNITFTYNADSFYGVPVAVIIE